MDSDADDGDRELTDRELTALARARLAAERAARPWWKKARWWVVGVVVVLALGAAVSSRDDGPTAVLVATTTPSEDEAEPELEFADDQIDVEPVVTEPAPTTEAPPREGTRANPFPVGATVSIHDQFHGDWEVRVNWVRFWGGGDSSEPPPGLQYVLVNYAATYLGPDPKARSTSLRFSTVDDANVEYDHPFCIEPDPSFPSTDVFQGGTVEGNQCMLGAVSRASSLLLYLDLGFGDAQVFFATR